MPDSDADLQADPAGPAGVLKRAKRVAVLPPVAWRTPPRHYGAWETVASNNTEGLVARGWNATLFATRDSITRARLHAVIEKGTLAFLLALEEVTTLQISTGGERRGSRR